VVQTSAGGYAEVNWKLGSTLGTQTVTASVLGVTGSPATFTAEAVADPNSLALELVDLMPADGASDVAVTTTILATFSRAVDPATITTTSFYLHETSGTAAVPGKFGFTDQFRKVSIAPSVPLAFSTPYTLEISSGVKDANSGALDHPTTAAFTTAAAPPLALKSVSPPSATAEVTVVLSGVSFNATASQNKVLFNNKQAIPFAGAFDYLKVNVPVGAQTGTVRVYNGADTSNALAFGVLVPTNTAADEVVATAGTGTPTKGVTINPDGSMAYAVSPENDVVVPIDIATKTSLQAISVGDYPMSIDVHPDGTYAYVPNFTSGTLSIIGTDKNVPAEYHKVVKTLLVGSFPNDVVVNPDGNWVYVVNAGSNFSKNIDIIDSDDQSVNHHTVVATAGTGVPSKGVTINPDGSRLYVGTNTGYKVLNSGDLSYSVIATAGTGIATKGVTINPDGSLLFVLTTEGNVKIYNIVPNSLGENDVVATVQGSSATKGITLNPDGTILYLIQEENDAIEVVGIDIQGAIGVIESDGTVPPFQVVTTVLGSFFAGEDPEAIVFDPTGSGLALVTNSGPQTVTFLNTSFVAITLPADPLTIPAYTTVPFVELAGFRMKNITDASHSYAYMISTTGPAALSGGTLSSGETASQTPSAVRELLSASAAAAVASAYTEVVGVTPVLAPGDSFAPPPAVLAIPAIREHVEQSIVYRVSIVGNPSLWKEASRLAIIEEPVAVFVSGFSAEALDDGVRLSWEVVSDEDVTGFKIYRAETSSGPAELVNVEGLVPVADRQWMDDHAQSNREYDYTLGVVLSDGSEVLSQTVKVKTKALVLALQQNYPNPFNPATTIEFTIPEKQHVTLSVYNVAGQRVATLVDQVMTEGHKKFLWSGRNSRGDSVTTGVYFYRLQAGEKTLTKKMILLK
jgi:DNA-binding beta-propeller fold protein YncE